MALRRQPFSPPPPSPSSSRTNGGGGGGEENMDTAESDLIATLERRRDQAQAQQQGSPFKKNTSSYSYSTFDQYPSGTAVPGERLPLGDHLSGDSFGRIYDMVHTSKEQGTDGGPSSGGGRVRTRSENLLPTDSNKKFPDHHTDPRRRHPGASNARSISSSSILQSSAASSSAAPRQGRGPTLQTYRRLSKIEISSTRAVLQQRTPTTTTSTNGINSKTTTTLNWDKKKNPGNTDTDLIANAVRIDKLFGPSPLSLSLSSSSHHDNRMASAATILEEGSFPHLPSTESIPLLDSNRRPSQSGNGNSGINSSERQRKKWIKSMRQVCGWLHPWHMIQMLLQTMEHSWAVLVGFPAAVVAWILYYYMDNPELDFLPGETSLSWWINFSSRLICTLDLARLTQYLYIDQLSLKSSFTVTVFGPYFTLLSIQARGWPFVLTMWGVWNLVVLHGDNPFQTHWLYRTGLAIYTEANSGSYILHSATYLRCLLAMIVAGVAMGVKRTMVAMYFGRRTIANYKPKMEALLDDIILVAQIAELAEEASKAAAAAAAAVASSTVTAKGGGAGLVGPEAKIDFESVKSKFRGVQFHDMTKSKATTFDGSNTDDNSNNDDATEVAAVTTTEEDEDEQREALEAEEDKRSMDEIIEDAFAETETDDDDEDPVMVPGYQRSASEMDQIRNSLDRWQEPINKLDKSDDASMGDILKFRKALEHMDGRFPFGEAYGPAWTRDESLESALSVYRRLLTLSPEGKNKSNGRRLSRIDNLNGKQSAAISFDLLRLLATDDEGREIREKVMAFRRLFRPNLSNEILPVAFVQSCDSVYRRLRYFRASVGNASVTDKVLENIVSNMFNFILILVVLGILNINPWPILASTSAMLVSLSFAFGTSASRYFDGMLLIVVRRPYDLGDRIIINDPTANEYDARRDSWYVEDINLFTTTVRRGRDSTIATLNNSSIALLKIVNCARSPNAAVSLEMKFDMKMNENGNSTKFQMAVEEYLESNPRSWDSLKFLLLTELDTDNEHAIYHMTVIHRLGWQDAVRVAQSRSALVTYCFKAAKELGVQYSTPMPSRVLYHVQKKEGGENDTTEDGAQPLASTNVDDNAMTSDSFIQERFGEESPGMMDDGSTFG